MRWIEDVTGERLGNADVGDVLKDGQVLCRLINKLRPGSVSKINDSPKEFPQMENINKFIKGMKKAGVQQNDLFEARDLFEGKDLDKVLKSLWALGRSMIKDPNWDGPNLGVMKTDKALLAHLSEGGGMDDPASKTQRIREVFEEIDSDGNGTLDSSEIKQAMQNFGAKMSDDEIAQFLQEFDVTDGEIDFEGWEKLVEMMMARN